MFASVRPAALALALFCGGGALADEPIRPLPKTIEFDRAKAALGKKLFFDVRLARDDKVSCASCHDLAKGGADPRPRSAGVDGRLGALNSPSVFNTAFNFRQLWNGRAETLEEQIDLVIVNPAVFDSSWDLVLGKLGKDTALVRAFKHSYPDGRTRKNLIDALAIFERSLVTPSRFDAYLRGDAQAISADEKLGYARFKSYGCVACHQGVNVVFVVPPWKKYQHMVGAEDAVLFSISDRPAQEALGIWREGN